MLPSIHDLLSSCFSTCLDAGALFDRDCVSDLLSLAESLPAGAVSGGLECRLAPGRHAVDLGICVEREQAVGLLDIPSPPWLKQAIARWVASEDPIWRSIPRVWIEFDRPGPSAPREGPARAWSRAFPFFAIGGTLRTADLCETLATISAPLAAGGDDGLCPESMAETRASLPAGAALLHLGLLAHRVSPQLRLQAVAATEPVFDWLSASGGSLATSADLLRRLLKDVGIDAVTVQVSRTKDGFSPHSVEVSAPHHGDKAGVWSAILERAVEYGLATEEKMRALLRWPGRDTAIFSTAPARVRIDRIFHLTLRVDGEPALKGYGYFYPQYVLG